MSLQLAVLAAGLLLSAAAADARLARKHTPDPPKWPAQYQVCRLNVQMSEKRCQLCPFRPHSP